MTTKKATFKVDNGSTYDEIMFKTTADQVFFSDGSTFQNKLDSGVLKGNTGPQGIQGIKGDTGPQGPAGAAGLTTSVTVNGTKYNHSSGNITLPNYPTLESLGASESTHSHNWDSIGLTPSLFKGDGAQAVVCNDSKNIAYGGYSLAEGISTSAQGFASHAEGYKTSASGYSSHTEGSDTVASGVSCHAEGGYTTAAGDYSHAEGYSSSGGFGIAYGKASHTEGYDCVAGTSRITDSTIYAAHAEGYKTYAGGKYSHAEGDNTMASGDAAHSEGNITTASGAHSHAEGYTTTASGVNSHAEGYGTIASSTCTHAEGANSTASGSYSHAQNYSTIAQGYSQTTIGQYNVAQGATYENTTTDSVFIVGNGSTSSRSNAFRITWGGQVYSKGAYSTTGADYAEMFEWNDGNPENEERLGYFVTFEEGSGKIRKANSNDTDILGVVSVNAAIIGDDFDEDWKNKYIKDKWGRIQYEIIEIPEEKDEQENIISPARTQEVPILNPNYVENEQYVSRKDRKEWAAIGLIGKLLVYNDGTCKIGDRCMPNNEGIATKSEVGYRVIDVQEDLVKILFK